MSEKSLKKLDSVSIVPPEKVTLCGPYENERETFIAIHNPVKQLIAFKLKSSPGISVKPRFGYIRSKGETFIKVKASAGEPEDELTAEKHYYIKITLARAPKDPPEKPNDFWKEGSVPETVLKKKLQIVFKIEVEKASSDSTSGSRSSDSSRRSVKETKKVQSTATIPVDKNKEKAEDRKPPTNVRDASKDKGKQQSIEEQKSLINFKEKDKQQSTEDQKSLISFKEKDKQQNTEGQKSSIIVSSFKDKDKEQKPGDKKSSTSCSPTSKDKGQKPEDKKMSTSASPTSKDKDKEQKSISNKSFMNSSVISKDKQQTPEDKKSLISISLTPKDKEQIQKPEDKKSLISISLTSKDKEQITGGKEGKGSSNKAADSK